MTPGIAAVADVARRLLPEAGVITDRARLRTYECDGLAHYRVTPGPGRRTRGRGPARGASSGPAPSTRCPTSPAAPGPACPAGRCRTRRACSIVTSRMRAITAMRPEDQRAVVEPGVINLDVTRAATPHGYYYAPDPSSQQICSIGGNVAENSGGAHCLKYGFTTNHVLGADFVTAEGDTVALGGTAPDSPGYDLLGAVVGSEGTLGIVTSTTVRLVRLPEEVRTILVGFESTDQAGAATSAIISAGIVPAAIEMMDALAIEAAEAAVHCNYPDGAGAVLVIELDGAAIEVEQEYAEVERLCGGERRVRAAAGHRPGRPGADLEGPQVRVRGGRPDQPRLHRPGRRDPAHRAARGAVRRSPTLSGSSGRPGGQRVPRRRRQPAPAGALRRRRRGCRRGGREGQRRDPRPVHRARRVDHRRARRRHGQGEVHAADVHRRRPRHHADGALRVRPRQHLQPRQGLPDPAALRGGARTSRRAPTRRRKPAWRRSSDEHRHPGPYGARGDRLGLRRRARRRGTPTTSTVWPPASSPGPPTPTQVAEVLRAATAHGLTVVPRGRGTKLSWGTPPVERRRAARRQRARPGPRPRRRRPDRRRPGRRPARRRPGGRRQRRPAPRPRRDRPRHQHRRPARHQHQRSPPRRHRHRARPARSASPWSAPTGWWPRPAAGS